VKKIYLFLEAEDIRTKWERIVPFCVLLFLFMKDNVPSMQGSVDPHSSPIMHETA